MFPTLHGCHLVHVCDLLGQEKKKCFKHRRKHYTDAVEYLHGLTETRPGLEEVQLQIRKLGWRDDYVLREHTPGMGQIPDHRV